MLQVATTKKSGKKKQLRRAGSEESDDEGGDPDSGQSFTLAPNKGTIIFGHYTPPQKTFFISSMTKPKTASSLRIMPNSHYSWKTKHQAPTSTTFSVTS